MIFMAYVFISDCIILWQFSASWQITGLWLYEAVIPTVDHTLQKCICVCYRKGVHSWLLHKCSVFFLYLKGYRGKQILGKKKSFKIISYFSFFLICFVRMIKFVNYLWNGRKYIVAAWKFSGSHSRFVKQCATVR